MKGSIQPKIGKDGKPIYYAVVRVNNKPKWYRGGPTKKDAQRILNEKLTELDKGTYREPSHITFDAFADKWLNDYADKYVKPNTYDSYEDIITRLLKPNFGTYKVRNITTGMLQKFVSDRLKVVSAKTVINEYAVITIMFKHAKTWEGLYTNPALELIRPRFKKNQLDLKDILNPSEFELFLYKVDSHYKVAFLTAVLTGLRAGELWGLTWGHIDWNSKQILVRQQYSKFAFGSPKTVKSIREVDIPPSLLLELKKWKLACPPNEHDLVFPSPEGKISCHDNVVKRYFDSALRLAGLRHVSFHSLRHTNASIRIMQGQKVKYIQKQMGHASIQMTMDVYGHLFEDTDFGSQQAELMEGLFNSVRKPLENEAENKKEATACAVTS